MFSEKHFSGRVDFSERFNNGSVGSVEWAANWSPARDGFMGSYCNSVPTSEGGTHESGFWTAILKGIRAHGEFASVRRAQQITRDDLQASGCAMVSCFIRDPEFVGQTKNRLATVETQRLVEHSVRDHFDNWLATNTKAAGALLDYLVQQSEDRLRRRAEKETARKSATKRIRLPRKTYRLFRKIA